MDISKLQIVKAAIDSDNATFNKLFQTDSLTLAEIKQRPNNECLLALAALSTDERYSIKHKILTDLTTKYLQKDKPEVFIERAIKLSEMMYTMDTLKRHLPLNNNIVQISDFLQKKLNQGEIFEDDLKKYWNTTCKNMSTNVELQSDGYKNYIDLGNKAIDRLKPTHMEWWIPLYAQTPVIKENFKDLECFQTIKTENVNTLRDLGFTDPEVYGVSVLDTLKEAKKEANKSLSNANDTTSYPRP